MSLYGFPREPEATDVETPEPYLPHQRVASEPVAIPPSLAGPPPTPLPTPTAPDPLDPSQPWHRTAAGPAPRIPGYDVGPGNGALSGSTWSAFSPTGGVAAASAGTANGGSTAAIGTESMGTESMGTESMGTVGMGTESVGRTGTAFGSLAEMVRESGPLAEPPAGPDRPTVAPPKPMADPLFDDEPVIPPWDRKPLMIVIAAALVLVVIGLISGVASAAMFTPTTPMAAWRAAGSAPEPAPSTSPAPAVPPVVQDTITLSGVGDVIMGAAPGSLPPNNGNGFFDPVKQALAADLVMGNLETPLTEPTGFSKCGPPPSDGCFQFYLPPSYANYMHDAGFQLMNLANNHTNDMGAQGLANTRAALTAAGLQYTGGVDQITYVTVKGMKVAVLGFSVYSWGASLNNIPAATELVRKADQEADLVVIQMQGGAEGSDKTHVSSGHEIFLGEDRGDLIAFSHAVIDAGADVIFGHGPHVMRGMEFYKGRLIAYSLGNFCGYKVLSTAGYLGVGGVLKVTLHKDGSWAGGSLIATEMVNGGIAAPDDDRRALAFVNGLSHDDFGANAASISATDGKITPPA